MSANSRGTYHKYCHSNNPVTTLQVIAIIHFFFVILGFAVAGTKTGGAAWACDVYGACAAATGGEVAIGAVEAAIGAAVDV